jgi:aldehyde dehydrogenase (NAD+)
VNAENAKQATMPQAPPRFTGFDRLYVNGEWLQGAGDVLKDRDPYTWDVLFELAQASEEQVDLAYRSAARIQRGWAAAPPGARSEVLRRIAGILDARRDEIISLLVQESGSTVLKAALEWFLVRTVALEASMLPYRVEGRILPCDVPGKESRAYRKPVGVVGVISPFNAPLQLAARSIFPAIAVGNAVVLKPSEETPVSGGLLLAKIFEEAGVPPGVLNVVVGDGPRIGNAVVTHPLARVISFTGSSQAGRVIATKAAQASVMKRVILELGGNAPFVVLKDADLDLAAKAAVWGKFAHQGQICMIANRFIVEAPVYEDFTHRFVELARAIKVGDPKLPDTFVGPLINRTQLESVLGKIDGARKAGFRELLGGAPAGLVLPPHIFADVHATAAIAQEETFGPVAPILRANSEEEALAMANDTTYGLAASVFTRDGERGVRFAQNLECGMVHVNDQSINDLAFSPFGGEKNSGSGRFNGQWAVDAFTTEQGITIQHDPRFYPMNMMELAAMMPPT